MELLQKQILTQKLVLTQTMQQILKIIQLPRLELIEYIRQEIKENPLLEEKFPTGSSALTPEATSWKEPAELRIEPDEKEIGDIDFNWREYFRSQVLVKEYFPKPEESNKDKFLESIAAEDKTLREHLFTQLRVSCQSEFEERIGEYIIGNIDDNGYLRMEISEIAQVLGVAEEDVLKIQKMIQRFEPIGSASRSLAECLYVQLEELHSDKTVAKAIVKNYLDDLANKDYSKIAEALSISVNEVEEAAKLIAKLDPTPGQKYEKTRPIWITPDVNIEEREEGIKVTLNDEGIPRLKISPFYRGILENKDTVPPEVYKYVKEKFRRARELLRGIDQRKKIIQRIVEEVFKVQQDFLKEGIPGLKPLVLEDIAAKLGIHKSTVSRATTGKYVQTSRGIFELKYFFTRKIETEGGGFISSKEIKARLKEIINSEPPEKPLSDQEIIEILNKEGINIARRTLSKYRQEIGIPPSNKRKTR